MSLLRTFGEVKQSRVIQVAAACSSSDEFRSLVNEATETLLQRGDWPGTVVPARFMVKNGCVVWPRWVGAVRRINRCTVPLKVGTIWSDFIDRDSYLGMCGGLVYSWGGCCNSPVSTQDFRPNQQLGSLVNQGRVPTYNDIPADNPRYVRAYTQNIGDAGKVITLFGIDANGNPLMTLNSDNTKSLGATITLTTTFGSTTQTVQRIDAVLKPVTQAPVSLYSYEPISDSLFDLAVYAPDETNPQYRKDRIAAYQSPGCSASPFTVIALIKMEFIPVTLDTDYVQVPSVIALKKAIQAVKYGEAGDINNQALFLQSAVNELNMVLGNEYPVDQMPIDEGFSGDRFGIGLQSVI